MLLSGVAETTRVDLPSPHARKTSDFFSLKRNERDLQTAYTPPCRDEFQRLSKLSSQKYVNSILPLPPDHSPYKNAKSFLPIHDGGARMILFARQGDRASGAARWLCSARRSFDATTSTGRREE